MRYMGGKFRQSKAIVAELVRRCNGKKKYHEPFCGAMGVAHKALPALHSAGVVAFVLSDVSLPLVNMWKSAVSGKWEPPDFVSEDMYEKYKEEQDPEDPNTAYIGHACSFGGKWFGGLARHSRGKGVCDHTKKSQINQKLSVLTKAGILRVYKPKIVCCSYNGMSISNSLVYLDPPYADRTKAHKHNGSDFNHDEFWKWASGLRFNNNDVIATEFIRPNGWKTIHSWGDTVVRHKAGVQSDGTNERIFEFGSRVPTKKAGF